MAEITISQLLAALKRSDEERPAALSAKISIQGQHGDPVRYVKIEGLLDLGRVVELLNEHQ